MVSVLFFPDREATDAEACGGEADEANGWEVGRCGEEEVVALVSCKESVGAEVLSKPEIVCSVAITSAASVADMEVPHIGQSSTSPASIRSRCELSAPQEGQVFLISSVSEDAISGKEMNGIFESERF